MRRVVQIAVWACVVAFGCGTAKQASVRPDGGTEDSAPASRNSGSDGAGQALEALAPPEVGSRDLGAAPSRDSGPPQVDQARGDANTAGDANAVADARNTGDVPSPVGSVAPVFDGMTGYVEIPDDDAFSQPTYGALTVEAWIRPDSLSMPRREGSGYVHWMGKGVAGQHEWVSRMYQQGNAEGRANRISFYSFNLTGNLGAGSYFEDPVTPGEWIYYVGTFDSTRVYIFKNGMPRDSDLLSGYDITPRNGTAPLRIGTRDLNSFFQGSIARVAIYGARLTDAQVMAHWRARASAYDATVLGEPSLVAYYKLDETSGSVARDSKGTRHGTYHGGVRLGGATWAIR